MPLSQWQYPPTPVIPSDFLQAVKRFCPGSDGQFAAQLLWQRGINTLEKLRPFVNEADYQPTSPFVFGQEMKWAVNRLKQALEKQEKVTIWGDFDADGITATSVLWEGLGQFFQPGETLGFYIPNRLEESHGLNIPQLEKLKAAGVSLIITCDTGCTNFKEIDYAQDLGLDLIITDHHTIPDDRPNVIAMINPRYLSETHPLYHLSGVAVAYKLVEALYLTLPAVPKQPLESLLDLVAIGLIADLVELKGDCRYLAQKGLKQLKTNVDQKLRPGIGFLLKYCQKNGDRPTDISFGIGPRLNAISRIHGDAAFAVQLLTSRDETFCQKLALETELANTRRQGLQKRVLQEAKKQLAQLDLSTTSIIILSDRQWPGGILGLVASQIAQEYGRPAILLTHQGDMALGSARSVRGIDLYELLKSQQHLMTKFGGHPLAAGLSLPLENLPLFQEAMNQKLWQQYPEMTQLQPQLAIDLIVTVADLGKALFQELKLLEPCGMGNPVPKLAIKQCQIQQISSKNIQDQKKAKISYQKTSFVLLDETVTEGFPGVWWGHSQEEIPPNQTWDVVVELDFNPFYERYEVRLWDLQPTAEVEIHQRFEASSLLDWRGISAPVTTPPATVILSDCPHHWSELQQIYQRAIADHQTIALAYHLPENTPQEQLEKLLDQMAYFQQQKRSVPLSEFQQTTGLKARLLSLILSPLLQQGYLHQTANDQFTVLDVPSPATAIAIHQLLPILQEQHFQQQYLCEVPLPVLAERLSQSFP